MEEEKEDIFQHQIDFSFIRRCGNIFFSSFSPSSAGVERQDTVRTFLCFIVVGSKVKRVNYSHKKSLAPVKRESKSKKSSCSVLWGEWGRRDLCGVKITFHCATAALFSFWCLYDTHRCHGVENNMAQISPINCFLSQFLPRRAFNATQFNEIWGNCIDISSSENNKQPSKSLEIERRYLRRATLLVLRGCQAPSTECGPNLILATR